MLDGAIDVAGSILQTAFGWLGIAPTDEDIEYLKQKRSVGPKEEGPRGPAGARARGADGGAGARHGSGPA